MTITLTTEISNKEITNFDELERALIMTSSMAVSPEENLVDTLMMELNSSEEFRETTERFIKHFNR